MKKRPRYHKYEYKGLPTEWFWTWGTRHVVIWNDQRPRGRFVARVSDVTLRPGQELRDFDVRWHIENRIVPGTHVDRHNSLNQMIAQWKKSIA